ncbi:tetratricopeptide repeat protein [Hymenobacter guriensis]|uniref:Tetratricopeptide repeat protein n=1 Tax=Hymenobacter guriensis TaxID=2793065 RepID=A0ABS0L5G9_9BACT|nr:tetratricopeptide repeat protein [Hymenobacter guriensis]MBG8555413.1 tetratricopeptide repeat protein [Hymenobacter guriensis]
MPNLLRLFPLVLLVSALLPSCTLPRMLKVAGEGQQVAIRPAVLETNGENVLFEVQARVPARHLRKGYAYGLRLSYRYDNNLREDTVGRVGFASGEYVYDEERKDLLVATRQFNIPFVPRKNPGQLLATPEAQQLKPNGKRKTGKPFVVARGIVTTSRLVVRPDSLIPYLPEPPANLAGGGTRVLPFFFDTGESKIRNYLGTNVAALEEFIEANQKTELVMVVAANSPEPLETKNPRLAEQRTQALVKYFKNRIDVNSYLNSVSAVRFETKAYRNRWDLFMQKVQESALQPAQVDSIITILNEAKGTFAEREEQLHRLSYFDYLEQYIYPVMRFGTVAVQYSAPQRYESEIYLLSKKIVDKQMEADALTPEELRYSATLTPLLAEKQRIYETAIATTGRWEAYHNLGVVLAARADKEVSLRVKKAYQRRAATNFILAAHRNPTALTFYRAATAYHRAGDKLEALQSYDYAIKLGGPRPILNQVFADKAALEIEIGQPEDALRSISFSDKSYQNTMNRALVYLLKDNPAGAATIYQEALQIKPNDPLAYYCLAIIAARQQDAATMGLHLRRAVQLDRSFAQRAVEDLEFREFAGNRAFVEALK